MTKPKPTKMLKIKHNAIDYADGGLVVKVGCDYVALPDVRTKASKDAIHVAVVEPDGGYSGEATVGGMRWLGSSNFPGVVPSGALDVLAEAVVKAMRARYGHDATVADKVASIAEDLRTAADRYNVAGRSVNDVVGEAPHPDQEVRDGVAALNGLVEALRRVV